ncbi:SDR family NAD(P)-dependent oxidoreductase [Yokenella regensburgei]|jgi:NAD(P)-dependent dehydrogenase (short-subunit alcohol dehydrogenase family)|uniref:3-oxoacyl-[acyl-carrier-protein] reductase FabG n=1 Tax=Yokenella regensburgei TaxID=158877 RepID=A0AB38FQ35_9ENTR|nr:SDR family oxidoreductase [Yokenella regensburgei]SQA59955.1 3-oxoacyl-[acyl-carrier-protein] reductase FabG [Yokenella regensburgei]SQA67852.1 3-oxoacyl-[acyl-carrier-protein] reductase FabG [Yokenella regensburgei]SUQ06164.1 3-oxoacyl-[acyl-carrier-protein] reductase FabG [Yokenella regensburgei]
MLAGKVVVIFGGSGAIGSAVARAMARNGAQVYLGARRSEKLEGVAEHIRATGGVADTFIVDVLDERATREQIERLAQKTGGFDVVVNATGFVHDQGKGIAELTLGEFMQGITPFLSSFFTLSQAVLPHMGGERAGAILTVVAPAGPLAVPGHLGHIVGCAGTEAFVKALASELGPKNIRVVGVRSHAIADAVQAGSYTREVFTPKAQAMGLTVEQWVGGAAHSTMLNRLPTLAQVAEVMTFLASDNASAMTATMVNVTAGTTTS